MSNRTTPRELADDLSMRIKFIKNSNGLFVFDAYGEPVPAKKSTLVKDICAIGYVGIRRKDIDTALQIIEKEMDDGNNK